MAYADAAYGYHQAPTDSTLGSKRALYLDDDDCPVLDPTILDPDVMQSPDHAFRKDSFANHPTSAVLSPPDSHAWDLQYTAGLAVEPTSAGVSIPFHDDGNHFARHASQHPTAYPQQQHHQSSWPFDNGSGACTPTTTHADFMPPPPPAPHFDAPHQRSDSAHGNYGQPPAPPPQFFNVSQPEANLVPVSQVQTPMSPHSHQDWMGMAQQEMDARPSQKRMRPDSASRTLLDFQRGDGIRKKNGRIDIPQERNIQTIDDLIEKTTDDEMLKELKQQKRLLRNREAALASRQRKKKHTEDLEVKEKNFTQQISLLESKLNDLTIEREHRERERQMVHQRLAEAQRIIETMHDEKRELITRHTEETSSLRKKVQILTDQLEAGPAPVMSTVPSSTGYTDFSAEMEALNMGPHDWDNFILVNELQNEGNEDFSFDPKSELVRPAPALQKKSSAVTITQGSKTPHESTSETPIASGLLFMLLLCGAFVASKPSGSQPSDLPRMPPDVRAAAPTVLNNLLSDSSSAASREVTQSEVRMAQEPMASSSPYHTNPQPSRLDRMHRTLTARTKQQEIEQAFSLTTAQYASLTNMDFPVYNLPDLVNQANPAAPPRRSLAEALASQEQKHRSSKAEVYTRSLLWDQIPADVVRQFKEIVRDHHEIEQRQQQQQQRRPSHDFSYKTEQ